MDSPHFAASLQGLDFWVEPQGGHIADEDQDPFFRTPKQRGVEVEREKSF